MRKRACITFGCSDANANQIMASVESVVELFSNAYRAECFTDSDDYSILLKLLEQFQIEYILQIVPIFEQEELDAASYFTFYSWDPFAFPQPDGNNGYLDASYDLSFVCSACRYGAIQNRPLIVNKFPKKREYFSLNWVDALIVSERLASLIEAEALDGFELWPVLLGKSKKKATETTWRQLRIVSVMAPMSSQTPFERAKESIVCECGRGGRDIDYVAWYDKKSIEMASDFNLTCEWLGKFGSVRQINVISKKAYRFFRDNSLDVGTFFPVNIV